MTGGHTTETPGTILTFYSYKGGTGRSMTVANFACWLAKRLPPPARILMVDWDLEAPGLHRYFPKSDAAQDPSRPGLIDYFRAVDGRLDADPALSSQVATSDWGAVLPGALSIADYITPDVSPNVDLLKAGKADEDFARRVSSFNWIEFHRKHAAFLRAFREWISSTYSYGLIDSRTGFNDVSGLCTMLMPEKLVVLFTPNRQSLSGVIDLASRAIKYRRTSDDFRPLTLFPLPSRIENAEHDLKQKWRLQYQREFEATLKSVYELDDCDLTEYFDRVLLPHVSFYSYGEELAIVRESSSDALSLSRAYDTFFQTLDSDAFPWDRAASPAPPPPSVAVSGTTVEPFPLDVFISYAHVDNIQLSEQSQGWVTMFHRTLQIRLQQLLGRETRIYRDQKLAGNDALYEAQEQRIESAAYFVAIVSPAYVRSEWCRKELQTFLKHQASGAPPTGLIKILKSPVPHDAEPEPLQQYLGYSFFETEPTTGRVREFGYESSGPSDIRFLERISDIASDIARSSQELTLGPAAAASADRTGVYVAVSTSDLEDERNRVNRELRQRGYVVLPDRPLPQEADALQAFVREQLARSRMSIHLLGVRYGLVPEGEVRSIAELQLLWAEERSRADDSFVRLVWMPQRVESDDERQRALVTTIENTVGPSDELFRAGFEDFKSTMVDRLATSRQPSPAQDDRASAYVYLICDNRDATPALALRGRLFASGLEVTTSLGDDDSARASQLHRDSLVDCDAAIIYYGQADERWLRSKLLDLRKASGWGRQKPMLASAIVIGEPMTIEKEHFATRDVTMVINTIGADPIDAVRQFQESLAGSKSP